MKATWAAIPITITAALLVAEMAVLQSDHMRSACYDAGRRVGGMEQRIYDARVNGDEVVKADADGVTKGAPEDCR